MTIDTYRLRRDLKDYYGTAMTGPFPMAVTEVSRVERASESELINMASRAGFNLRNYEIKN